MVRRGVSKVLTATTRRRRRSKPPRKVGLNENDKKALAQELMPVLEELGWMVSRKTKRPVDAKRRPIPWYSYPAIAFLAERVRPDMRVFEFGTGFSTLWWAEHASCITSVEHDERWAKEMGERSPDNAHIAYVELERNGAYCRSAATSEERPFHVVVIDGRDRVNCARNCLSALRDDGVIIWDNTDRRKYAPGRAFLVDNGFKRLPFAGLGPRVARLWETTVFYRPDNCFEI
jgi:hypothetical protein